MSVTVPEAARALGVADEQVRVMIRRGELPARQASGRWLIEDEDLSAVARRRPVRPMDARMAAALLAVIDGRDSSADLPVVLSPTERARLSRHVERLGSDPEPRSLLTSWLANRMSRTLRLSAASADVPALTSDLRVRCSGVSDPRSGLVWSPGEFHGWVAAADAEPVLRDYLLVESRPANVVLRVTEGTLPEGPVPLSWVIADLASVPGTREGGQAERLLSEALTSRRR